jgi:hypothetical protein
MNPTQYWHCLERKQALLQHQRMFELSIEPSRSPKLAVSFISIEWLQRQEFTATGARKAMLTAR